MTSRYRDVFTHAGLELIGMGHVGFETLVDMKFLYSIA
jgi:hypothetical protein